MLDSVVEQIVSVLAAADSPLTSREIALRIGMSESSVRHKMPAARAFAKGSGVRLCSARGKGFWVEGGAAARSELRVVLERERDRSGSYNYQRDCILNTLSMRQSAYTIQLLAEDLGVSRGTVVKDLDAMEIWLAPFGVGLIRIRNSGVSLVGDEMSVREALIESRHQLSLEMGLALERPDDLDYRLTGTFYNYFRTFYGDDDKLRYLQDVVLDAEHGLRFRFEDGPFLVIFEHIALMYDRVRAGCPAPEGASAVSASPAAGARELAVAEAVAGRLFDDVSGLGRETAELAALFKLYGVPESGAKRPSEESRSLARTYLSMVRTATGGGFDVDDAMVAKVADLLDRKSVQESYRGITNKYLVRDVKHAAPRLFAAALMCSRLVAARPGVPALGIPLAEADVAYVAMLAGNALGTADEPVDTLFINSFDEDVAAYVTRKLEHAVPELRVVKRVDIGDAEFEDLSRYDIAITSVLLGTDKVIKVSRRMDDADIELVRRRADEVRRRRERVTRLGTSLLSRPVVLLDSHARRKEAAIEEACALLREQGLADEGLLDNALRGEEVAASSVGLGVAVPCAVGEGVRRSALAVVRLRRPVYWGGGEHVDLVFLFAIAARRGRRAESVPAEFYALMGTDAVQRVREAECERDVRAVLRDAGIFRD